MLKKIFILTLILSMILTPVHKTYASKWGESIAGQVLDNVLETIREEIIKAINSSMKMMAIKQATSMIETVLYGGSSSPRNIKNFRKFLFEDTHNTAVAYGETFLTSAMRGTSSGDYSAAGGAGSLSADIKASGDNVIANWKGSKKATVDFASACSGDAIIDQDYKCLSKILSNPLNSPIGMAIAVDASIAAKYQEEIERSKLEATASGSLPDKDKKTGNVKLPLSVVLETQLQRITMPLQALATADSGVFSSVIQAFVVGLVVGVVQKGLSEVEAAVDDAVQSFEDEYTDAMGEVYDKVGPIADFAEDSYDATQKIEALSEAQKTDVILETSDDESNNTGNSTQENPSNQDDIYSSDIPGYTSTANSADDKFVNPTTSQVTNGSEAGQAAIEWNLSRDTTANEDAEWVDTFNSDHGITPQ